MADSPVPTAPSWLDAVAARDAECQIAVEEGDFQYTNVAGRDRRHLLRLVRQLREALNDLTNECDTIEVTGSLLRCMHNADKALAACDAATPPGEP